MENVVESSTFIENVIEKHGREKSALIPILQEIQKTYRYLPED
ncbi:MAG: NAD(P)H-dependent oxidoreductase subunit E, partial [Nitrospirae bacterium]